ncbi:MAG: thymidine kinase [Alphaproteobacteria bacterium]|nr:thymidine kinase [Alphaproteobacteria bacterium]
MAKLYFSYAAMNAGKSTILLQAAHNYQERGMQTLLYTSSLYAQMDNRSICSRIGLTAAAELYDRNDDLFEQIKQGSERGPLHCIFVDEAQFLTKAQVWQLARVTDRLGLPVMCYGLRTDFVGNLFEGSRELLAIADVLREVRTICECGSKATMVARMDEAGNILTQGDQVAIGKSVYTSLCRKHWEEYTGRWPCANGDSPKFGFNDTPGGNENTGGDDARPDNRGVAAQ